MGKYQYKTYTQAHTYTRSKQNRQRLENTTCYLCKQSSSPCEKVCEFFYEMCRDIDVPWIWSYSKITGIRGYQSQSEEELDILLR